MELKHQTGIRIDRILFKQFQQICALEKLRPGEAVESIIRLAVNAKTVTGVHLDHARLENTVRIFDDVLFRSRLSRLKTAVELEQRVWKETGNVEEDESKESEYWIKELTDLGRRNVSPELVREFEACLSESDKYYAEIQKFDVEEQICLHRSRIKE